MIEKIMNFVAESQQNGNPEWIAYEESKSTAGIKAASSAV